jgi:myo-inositol catabolism protein IolS
MEKHMRVLKGQSLSSLAFGGGAISGTGGGYSLGELSGVESLKLLDFVYERGVRLFDTAPIYGFGESEKRLGEAFKKKRDDVFIVSKSGVDWHDNGRVNMTNDPQVAIKMLHQSLKRLESDYIDLYMVHWPDPRIDIRFTYEVLVKAKEQGKIRYLGLCNSNILEVNKAREIASVDVLQFEYNLWQRQALSLDLKELIEKDDISTMVWGGLDKGWLSGRIHVKRKFDETDARSHAFWWKKQNFAEKYRWLEKLQAYSLASGHSLQEIAILYILKKVPLLDGLCLGAKNKEDWENIFNIVSSPDFSFFKSLEEYLEKNHIGQPS